MHTTANTIRSSRGVTVLVPEFTRLRGPPNESDTGRFTGISGSGETRTRTGDTTIFSRLPATAKYGRVAAESRARITSPCSRGFPHFPRDCGPLRHAIANLCLNDVGALLRASGLPVPRDRVGATSGAESPPNGTRRSPHDGVAEWRSTESATRRVRGAWRWSLPVTSSMAALGPAATHRQDRVCRDAPAARRLRPGRRLGARPRARGRPAARPPPPRGPRARRPPLTPSWL